MKNKFIISDHFRELMDEVNNPERPLRRWAGGLQSYDEANYTALVDKVHQDAKEMGERYGISILEKVVFRKNLEDLFISVEDYSAERMFLKDLVRIGCTLRSECELRIKGLQIETPYLLSARNVKEGVLAGLVKELEAFSERQKMEKERVDDILIRQIKSLLEGEEVDYPKGNLPDGRPYYTSMEDYLFSSIDYAYRDMGRGEAAQSLAYCFLGKYTNISIKEGAFIYDMLHYCGYVSEEQKEDKELEIYSQKQKYDMIKEFFGIGGKTNKKQ